MTFEEWLKTQPLLSDSHIRTARLAWEASRTACITECEIAVDNVMDAASYSITPVRLRYFKMGAKAALRDFKFRLR